MRQNDFRVRREHGPAEKVPVQSNSVSHTSARQISEEMFRDEKC
jgi:hypothetical protein